MKKVITYQLKIKVARPVTVQVGKLGILRLPRCICVYTGSAKRNIDSRIARHLSKDKKLRWHIDYLLAHRHVSVIEVVKLSEPECLINQRMSGCIVLRGFGSSDCRQGCGSHLKKTADI